MRLQNATPEHTKVNEKQGTSFVWENFQLCEFKIKSDTTFSLAKTKVQTLFHTTQAETRISSDDHPQWFSSSYFLNLL